MIMVLIVEMIDKFLRLCMKYIKGVILGYEYISGREINMMSRNVIFV